MNYKNFSLFEAAEDFFFVSNVVEVIYLLFVLVLKKIDA